MRSRKPYQWEEQKDNIDFKPSDAEGLQGLVLNGETFRIGKNVFECVGLWSVSGSVVAYAILNYTTNVAKWVGYDSLSKALHERNVVWLNRNKTK